MNGDLQRAVGRPQLARTPPLIGESLGDYSSCRMHLRVHVWLRLTVIATSVSSVSLYVRFSRHGVISTIDFIFVIVVAAGNRSVVSSI